MKKISVFIIALMLVVVLASNVSAYKLYCLGYGESLPDEQNPRYTCFHDTCQVCTTDANNPTHPAHCYNIGACQTLDGNEGGTIDAEPPTLVVNSPVEGEIYSGRRVLFDLESGEPSTFTYVDNVEGRGRIKNMARNVFDYSRELSLKDGFNDISIYAEDRNGNQAEQRVTFFVDSMDPRLGKANPSKGFANGEFDVDFSEENPESLVLHYGNDDGIRTANVDLNSCDTQRNKVFCQINVDLSDYDGEVIRYWFSLTDIAGNTDETRETELSVDYSAPVIVDDVVNVNNDGRNLVFSLDVIESFFDQVLYRYTERGKERESKLCNSLNDGNCQGNVRLSDGDNQVEVVAKDKAGNEDSAVVNIFVDTKDPKIRGTEPRRGFANGEFIVEFEEENPETLTLHYGNEVVGFRATNVNLNECVEGRRGTSCSTSVSLVDYDGQEIEYWFEIVDRVGNTDESRAVDLDVDITSPVLLNPDSFWVQGTDRYDKYIYFNLEIDEANLDEVTYIDNEDSRGREKRICNRLRDGVCEKKVSFRTGHHSLDVQITDEAGNAVSTQRIEFDVA